MTFPTYRPLMKRENICFLPPGLAGYKKFRLTFKSQRNGTAHLAIMRVTEK